MKHKDKMRHAADMLERGMGSRTIASALGVSRSTAENWVYAYRALGKEALLSGRKRVYSQEEKLESVRLVLDGGLSKAQVMEKMGIRSKSALDRWLREYAEGGPDALAPKPRGRRPKPSGRSYATREEELEARVRELELELEIQKRINALADEIERRSHRR